MNDRDVALASRLEPAAAPSASNWPAAFAFLGDDSTAIVMKV